MNSELENFSPHYLFFISEGFEVEIKESIMRVKFEVDVANIICGYHLFENFQKHNISNRTTTLCKQSSIDEHN